MIQPKVNMLWLTTGTSNAQGEGRQVRAGGRSNGTLSIHLATLPWIAGEWAMIPN